MRGFLLFRLNVLIIANDGNLGCVLIAASVLLSACLQIGPKLCFTFTVAQLLTRAVHERMSAASTSSGSIDRVISS